MSKRQVLVPNFKNQLFSSYNYYQIIRILKQKYFDFQDDDGKNRTAKFQNGYANFQKNTPFTSFQEVPTRIFAVVMSKIQANLITYEEFEKEAKIYYDLVIDDYIREKGSTIRDLKFQQMESMKKVPDRRQIQEKESNSILLILTEGASSSNAYKSTYQLLYTTSKHFTNCEVLKFHLNQLQEGKNLSPNITIFLKSGKQIEEENKEQKHHPQYLEALKERESNKLLYILNCTTEESHGNRKALELKYLKFTGSIDRQILANVMLKHSRSLSFQLKIGVLDLSQIQASPASIAQLLNYFSQPESIKEIKGLIIKNQDLSLIENNDLVKLFSEFPLEIVILQNCRVTSRQCHGIAHGLCLNNKISIKILRLVNITNTEKKTNGVGDQHLANIIESLDFNSILEITLNNVGGEDKMIQQLNKLLINSNSIKIIDIRRNFIPSLQNIEINKNTSLCRIDLRDNKRIVYMPSCCLFQCQSLLKRYQVQHDQQLYRKLENKVNIQNFSSEFRKRKIVQEQISQYLEEKTSGKFLNFYRKVKKKMCADIAAEFKRMMKKLVEKTSQMSNKEILNWMQILRKQHYPLNPAVPSIQQPANFHQLPQDDGLNFHAAAAAAAPPPPPTAPRLPLLALPPADPLIGQNLKTKKQDPDKSQNLVSHSQHYENQNNDSTRRLFLAEDEQEKIPKCQFSINPSNSHLDTHKDNQDDLFKTPYKIPKIFPKDDQSKFDQQKHSQSEQLNDKEDIIQDSNNLMKSWTDKLNDLYSID